MKNLKTMTPEQVKEKGLEMVREFINAPIATTALSAYHGVYIEESGSPLKVFRSVDHPISQEGHLLEMLKSYNKVDSDTKMSEP